MKLSVKITVSVVLGFALLVTGIAGYCFGLVVQQKYDNRFAAMWELSVAIRLHKALSVGDYDFAQREAINSIAHGEAHLSDGTEFWKWRVLFHESLDGIYDTGFRRATLAKIIGMRRVEPNIVCPIELHPELAAFVPRTEVEQHCLDFYAKWDPKESAAR